MDVLGIGPLELITIFIIILIILGPNEMVKAGKSLGQFLRNIVTSEGWKATQRIWREIRYFPNKLMREAGPDIRQNELEAFNAEINKTKDALRAWITPPSSDWADRVPTQPGNKSIEVAETSKEASPSKS
ncbi:MAG: twin-arginine translocase TatA/TatE family subunit [Chloroflexota bacterium]